MQMEIGSLGTFDFPAGLYIYTGSALGGIRQRVARHLRSEKRCRWHIDFLLGHAQVQTVAMFPTCGRLECELHRRAMERLQGQVIVRRFGSSDCCCPAHLGYLGARDLQEVRERLSFSDPLS